MTKLTQELLNTFNWNEKEEEILKEQGFESIQEKFSNLTEKQFNAICKYFDAWIFNEAPKARLNYWMKQTNLTEEEINIWMTW